MKATLIYQIVALMLVTFSLFLGHSRIVHSIEALVTEASNIEAPSTETQNSQQKTKVRVGLITLPPSAILKNDNICFGDAVDYVKRVFPNNRYNLSVYCASPARIYRDLKLNKTDVTINIKSTSSLNELVYFANKPYTALELMLYTKPNIVGNKVSAISKFEYHNKRAELTQQGYEFIDQANTKEALTVFLRGHTQHFISYKRPVAYYLAENQRSSIFLDLKTDFVEKNLLRIPTYLAVNKKTLNSTKILSAINAYNETNIIETLESN